MSNNTALHKRISTFSLTMTGVTTIIGSGWLLSTQKIAAMAGPASLLSWGLGAFIAMLVGFFYIEIGSAHPSAGGIGYYSHITHGRFCGFLTSWINWLSIVAVPPIEAQAVIQYMSQLSPSFTRFYDVTSHNLTGIGIIFAFGLMILFMLLNYWSIKFFLRFNNFFTLLKVAIPILTIIALFSTGLHKENFGTTIQTFMPFGWGSVFASVVSCGVVMSFNGFQSPLTFSEEIASPKRQLPIAVLGSIAISLVVYLLLQIVFVGSISPAALAHGWGEINFRSPYVQLLLLANFQLLVSAVYIGSVVSPGVCAVTFVASSGRIMLSLSREGHMPKFLSSLHSKYNTPWNAIIMNTVVGSIFLLCFKGWYSLVAVISVLHLFSYVPAPIVTIANRLKHGRSARDSGHFTLPFAHVLAPALLFLLSVLIFSAGWPLADEMALLIVPGLAFYFYYEYKEDRVGSFWEAFKGASWLVFYILGISLITYLANHTGASTQVIGHSTGIWLLLVLSIITYIYGAYFAYSRETYVRGSKRQEDDLPLAVHVE
jgi:amino acid transporter